MSVGIAKSVKLARQRDAKRGAECIHIAVIVRIQWVATVEFNHPVRRNALYGIPGDNTKTSQRISWIGTAVNAPARGVEGKGMNIYAVAITIPKHKIPILFIVNRHVLVTSRFENATHCRNIGVANGDVQVSVSACLVTEECVNAPSSVNPDFDLVLRK